jgi:hypothetical protein
MAARLLAEFDGFDGPAMDAVPGVVVIEGHIAGGEIIVDGTPAPTRRTRFNGEGVTSKRRENS